MKKIKEMQKKPEAMPQITPEMIENMRRILEAEGMIYYKEGGLYLPTEKGWTSFSKINSTVAFLCSIGFFITFS
jgi:hypothetical protein